MEQGVKQGLQLAKAMKYKELEVETDCSFDGKLINEDGIEFILQGYYQGL